MTAEQAIQKISSDKSMMSDIVENFKANGGDITKAIGDALIHRTRLCEEMIDAKTDRAKLEIEKAKRAIYCYCRLTREGTA